MQPKSIRISRIAGAGIASLMFLLSACGGSEAESSSGSAMADSASPEWTRVIEAAEKEGPVVVYTTSTSKAQLDRVTKAFDAAYPSVKSEVIQTPSSAEQVTRLEQEASAGSDGADVAWNTDAGFIQDFEDRNLVLPLDPAGSSDADWPEEFKAGAGSRLIYAPVVSLAWNSSNTNAIAQYEDLLDPSMKGRIGLIEASGSPVVAAYYDWLRTTQGDGIWEELAALDPKFYPNAGGILQAIGSGELSAGTFALVSAVNDLKREGAPVDSVSPEPAFAYGYYAAAMKNAKHPNSAQLWMDWAMSEDGQRAFVGDEEYVSPVNVEGTLTQVENIEIYSDDLSADEVAKITSEFNDVFGR